MLRDFLKRRAFRSVDGTSVGLMGLMGIEALYGKKKGTRTNPEHPIYPYLLRNLAVDCQNQAGAPISRISRCAAGSCISLRS